MKQLGKFIDANKILRHPHQIAKLREGRVPAVLNVEVDLSEVCQLRCFRCDFPEHYDAFMDPDTAIETDALLDGWGTQAVVLTGGGEPTLCPDFTFIVKLFANSFDLGLYTNGVKPVFLEVADRFKWIFVSLDAAKDYIWAYDKQSSSKLFHQVLENIAEAAKKTTVGVGFLIHMGNCHDVEKMVEVGLGAGASYVHFRPQFPTEDVAWKYDAIPPLERVAAKENVSVAWDKFYDLWQWKREYTTCWASMFLRQIDAEGNIWACPTTRWKRKLGDIWTFEGLKEPLQVTPECRACCRGHSTNKLLDYIMRDGPHDAFV